MLPLRDINPTKHRPLVTWVLIAMNASVFVGEQMLGHAGAEALVERFGLIPEVITSRAWDVPRSEGGAAGAWITPLSSMFLHAGWMHAVGNLWFLYVFGDNVEDVLGRAKYLAFYLVCGLAASALQVGMTPQSGLPMIGASGAISGVLGAYLFFFPSARVITWVPLFLFHLLEVPARLFILLWFGLQLLSGYLSLNELGGGVAWFAHIGGFIAGLGLAWLGRPKAPKRPDLVQ